MTQDLNRMFSDMVLQQARTPDEVYDFRSKAKLFSFLHPQVLRSMLSYLNSEDHVVSEFQWNGWYLHPFTSVEEAQSGFPELQAHRGWPHLFKLWMDDPHELMFDFESMGVAVFSKRSSVLESSLPRAMLTPWLAYATSPELWGAQGKWTRFHGRLETLFEKYGLVNGKNKPGHYVLSPKVKVLMDHQFLGNDLGDAVEWTLPWTFPLSGLEKLEAIMSQEF